MRRRLPSGRDSTIGLICRQSDSPHIVLSGEAPRSDEPRSLADYRIAASKAVVAMNGGTLLSCHRQAVSAKAQRPARGIVLASRESDLSRRHRTTGAPAGLWCRHGEGGRHQAGNRLATPAVYARGGDSGQRLEGHVGGGGHRTCRLWWSCETSTLAESGSDDRGEIGAIRAAGEGW